MDDIKAGNVPAIPEASTVARRLVETSRTLLKQMEEEAAGTTHDGVSRFWKDHQALRERFPRRSLLQIQPAPRENTAIPGVCRPAVNLPYPQGILLVAENPEGTN